jgi:hypothetical protein
MLIFRLRLILIFMVWLSFVDVTAQNNTDTLTTKKAKYDEQSTYWINRNYAICIARGKAPCDCLSENEIVMLYVDPYFSNKDIYVQSSVFYFGLETSAEFTYSINDENKDGMIAFTVPKAYPLKDSMKIVIADKLLLTYNGKSVSFEKYVLKTLDRPVSEKAIFSRTDDMWKQLNTFNANILLSYSLTNKIDSTELFFTYEELKQLVMDNKVSVSCSDDYHFNSMMVQGNPNQYFHVEFKGDTLILYNEKEGRASGEKVHLDQLEKQIFYKDK